MTRVLAQRSVTPEDLTSDTLAEVVSSSANGTRRITAAMPWVSGIGPDSAWDFATLGCPVFMTDPSVWPAAREAGEALARAVRIGAPSAAHTSALAMATEVLLPLLCGQLQAQFARDALGDTTPHLLLTDGGMEGLGFRSGFPSTIPNLGPVPPSAPPTAQPSAQASRQRARRTAAAANAIAAKAASRATLGRARSPLPKRCDVLLVEIFAYRLANLAPVTQALIAQQKRVVLLSLARTPDSVQAHQAWAQAQGITLVPWEAVARRMRPAAASALLRATAALTLSVHRELPDALERLADVVADAFDSAPPRTLSPAAHKRVRAAALGSGAKALALQSLFDAALTALTPDVVYTCRGDGPTLRALSAASAGQNVPVVDVQHGRQDLLPPGSVAGIAHAHFALSTAAAAAAYRAQGVADDHIHLVGSVGFDALLASAHGETTPIEGAYVVYSCSADGATAVDAWNAMTRGAAGAAPIAELHADMLTALDAHLTARPDRRLVVALHPRQSKSATAVRVAEMRNAERVLLMERCPNGPVFAGAVAHVSLGSTTAIEAALLGTPAVILEPKGHSAYFDDAERLGWVARANDAAGVVAALDTLGEQPLAIDEITRAYAVSADGRTAERILALQSPA